MMKKVTKGNEVLELAIILGVMVVLICIGAIK